MTRGVHLPRKAEPFANAGEALRAHWRLYCYEAAELAAFMISASLVAVLMFEVFAGLNPWLQRLGMGSAMGATAVAIILSPWGQASGAHFNPAISLTFYRLGKIGLYDLVWYVGFQFLGGAAGVGLSLLVAGRARMADPRVDYVVTVPGLGGWPAAFAAEFGMAALLVAVVLYTSNAPRLAKTTPYLMGLLIASYVLLLAPVSGFSINPARTVGSAVWADVWTAIWIYFVAPVAGMLGAAEVFVRVTRAHVPASGQPSYWRHRHVIERERVAGHGKQVSA